MQNNIKQFFNDRALNWDNHEIRDNTYFIDFVNKNIKINNNDIILDLGCGTGVITSILKSHTKNIVYGMDISDKMIEIAKSKVNDPNIRFICDYFYNTDLSNIDLIVCHNAYPHFMDKLAFKNKCYNILNNNGRLIICHSISRESINSCHKGKEEVSLILKSVDEEASIFTDMFSIINKYEDNNIYLIELKKLES